MDSQVTENQETMGIQEDDRSSIPSGIGLEIDQIRALLAEKHETVVGKDDPVLMICTLLNVFLEKSEKQNARLQAGMKKLLAEKTGEYLEGVNSVGDSLSESLSSASIEGLKNLSESTTKKVASLRASLTYASAIIAISALINVIAFVLLALK